MLPSHLRNLDLLVSTQDFVAGITTAGDSPELFDQIIEARTRIYSDTYNRGVVVRRDEDAFDPHYTHLVTIDRRHWQVAAGYRFCEADAVLARQGCGGLYTHKLYHYGPEFISYLGKPLEIGRMFIAPEYQKALWPFKILWLAILKLFLLNPAYRCLFGSVNIPADFDPEAVACIQAFCASRYQNPELFRLVQPKEPLPYGGSWAPDLAEVRNFRELNAWFNRTRLKEVRFPVLLSKYELLNATFNRFARNPHLHNVTDVLVCVDFSSIPRPFLRSLLQHDPDVEHLLDRLQARDAVA